MAGAASSWPLSWASQASSLEERPALKVLPVCKEAWRTAGSALSSVIVVVLLVEGRLSTRTAGPLLAVLLLAGLLAAGPSVSSILL